LRTSTRNRDWTYLGKLKYLTHDPQSGQGNSPVDFQWQILGWDISENVLERIGLVLSQSVNELETHTGINLTEPPAPRNIVRRSRNFRASRVSHTPERDAANRELGKAGEELVIKHEKKRLIAEGFPDLAEQVIHVAIVEGDGAGYDVRSFDSDGNHQHIEVKTTRGSKDSSFYITSNEVAFSERTPNSFYLYRLYNFRETSASMYVLRGNMNEALQLDPVNYRATVQ